MLYLTDTGTGVGVQRGVRGQFVVRAERSCVHRSVAHAQSACQRQQCCQLHTVLRRTSIPSPK